MSPWETLGIEPTSDPRAIRSAYVRRLKAIDVDADPAAFIVLREALEAVQAAVGRATVDVPEPVEPTTPDPVSPGSERPEDELARFLFNGSDTGLPTAEQAAEMRGLWKRIVDDPQMEQVGRFDAVERWASEVIARTVPFSDPLIVPAARRFGWCDRAESIHLSPAAAYLARRSIPMAFVNQVRRADHPFHAAWDELTRPADDDGALRRGKVQTIEIVKLVGAVLRDYPELYSRFDPGRLKLWRIDPKDYLQDSRDARTIGAFFGTGIAIWFFGSLLLRLLGVLGGH